MPITRRQSAIMELLWQCLRNKTERDKKTKKNKEECDNKKKKNKKGGKKNATHYTECFK